MPPQDHRDHPADEKGQGQLPDLGAEPLELPGHMPLPQGEAVGPFHQNTAEGAVSQGVQKGPVFPPIIEGPFQLGRYELHPIC